MTELQENPPAGRKYFKIGDVSRMLDVPASTLRFWEKDFRQLKPMKNKKGDRIYTLKDIEILREIKYLTHDKGLRISSATRKVKRNAENQDSNTELIKKLRDLRETLLEFKKSLD
ncbi:MAG: MerR family transcriptional regulator [Bacteroidetes bacterium]|nr:MerR family transcriptional regulator [Bacteroidota bacterium]